MRRVGVIGLGMAVGPHARSLLDLADRVEVAGCYSPTAARREAFSASYGLPVVDRMEVLLDDPTVSAVLVLTPPNTHAEVVARCAEAGKHVLLEKPLDATPEGSRAVLAAMERAGRTLGVVYQHRFRPTVERLKALVVEGALGTPLSASVGIRWWRGPAYYEKPGRGMKSHYGGGVLLTQGTHMLDLLVNLTDLPCEVAGFAVTSPLRRIDTEDVAAAILRYANGMLATVDATTAAFPGFPDRFEIAGTGGSATLIGTELTVRLQSGETVTLSDRDATFGGGIASMQIPHANHRAVLTDFLDALDTGRRPRVDGRETFKVHRLIEAILHSSETGAAAEIRRE